MRRYDPDRPPNPSEWLELDERERIKLAVQYHRVARIKLPNETVHACFHAIVENQIAEGLEPVVRAMARLTAEGLSRHDALHAIGSVVAEQVYAQATSKNKNSDTSVSVNYMSAVERLNAKEWQRKNPPIEE